MGYIGGDIIEVTYSHPTLGSGTLYCKANEDITIDPGGHRSDDDASGVAGDGQMIDKINRVRWSVDSLPILWDMTNTDELQKLADMAASPVLGNWTINHINGKIWGGKGKPVGDVGGGTNTAQIPLKLAGSDTLKSIS
jgi:hypothetical protein